MSSALLPSEYGLAPGSQSASDEALPFRGGWGLFLAYELAAQVEARLRLPLAPGPLPVAIAWRCPAAVLRDRDSGLCLAVVEAGSEHWLDLLADAAMAPVHLRAPGLNRVATAQRVRRKRPSLKARIPVRVHRRPGAV